MLNTVALLIPVFLAIVCIEWYVSVKRGDSRYSTGNTAINLTIGAIDQIGSLFYYVLLYFTLTFVYTHFRIIEIESWWYQWIIGYIAVDFLSYWYHRLSHEINILWAGHITHHSSEHFNFTNGFRTSVFQAVNRIFFWALLPVFGFSPVALVIILKVSGIYDFMLHTQYIRKLGFLEKILITPSLHRVHHGKNSIYIDKNYGSTFLIWDKLFGTYQEETEEVVYGITGPYVDNNPLSAIGYYYVWLWNAMKAAPTWQEKIKLLFRSPQHKPQVVSSVITSGTKNKVPVTLQLKQYAGFQIACSVAGIITLLIYYNYMSLSEVILCACIGILSLVSGTLIFTKSIKEGFVKRESTRLIATAVLAFIAMLLYSKMYFLAITAFLVISLVAMLSIPKVYSEFTRR